MAGRKLADADGVLHFGSQLQEIDQIRNRRASQAKPAGKFLVRHLEPVEVLLEAVGFFNRVEVGAMDVLDQGRLKDLLIVEVDDVNGNRWQAGGLCSAKPAFP